jgi:chromosome segregation ATPase
VNLLQRLHDNHRNDRQQWEQDLKKAKNQSSHLKEELKETIEDRIAWLEERFMEEIQSQNNRGGDNHSGASTVSTTHADTSDSDGDYYYQHVSSFGRQRRNGPQPPNSPLPAAEAAVEVSYDSAMALQRLDELERVVERQQMEKSELSTLLEHATKVTQQGEQLSANMQQQLQGLLKEVDQTAQKQKKYYREKVATQKRLLALLEQQHNNTVAEFNHEKSVLEDTIVQLTADKASLQKDIQGLQTDHEAQREAWEREKLTLQSVIRQLERDCRAERNRPADNQEGAYIFSSTSDDDYQDDDVSSIHQSTAMVRPGSSASVSSPRRDADNATSDHWDDNFDRAMVERDYFKQEAEQVKRELESLRSMTSNVTDVSMPSDAGYVKELEKQVQSYKRQLDKEVDHYRELTRHTQRQFDEYKVTAQNQLDEASRQLEESDLQHEKILSEFKRLVDEKQRELEATLAELASLHKGLDGDTRYRDSLEKRNDLASKIRKMERQRDDEKSEWKLRLETVIAENKRIQAEKDKLEMRLEESHLKHKAELHKLESKIGHEAKKWTECSTGAEAKNKRLSKELKESNAKLEKLKKVRENWEDLMERHALEAQEWASQLEEIKERHAAEKEELNVQLSGIQLQCDDYISQVNQLTLEIQRLKTELKELKSEGDTTASLKQIHKEETQRLTSELEKTKGEVRASVDKTNELMQSLESIRMDYRDSKSKWEKEVDEKDKQILELRVQCGSLQGRVETESASKFESETVLESMEELRKDVISIRETIERTALTDKTISSANFIQLSDEIGAIQTTVNDALAEITLGSEAMIEVKDSVDKVYKAIKSPTDSSKGAPELEKLHLEIRGLRDSLSSVMESQKSSSFVLNDSIRQEMVSELHQKEAKLAELSARLELVSMELQGEREKLASAEKEIATLNDQADAYGEELMRIQALNAGLEEALSATERKMEEAILSQAHQNLREGSSEYANRTARAYDDSTPFLEEALALAQGLTDLVHGKEEDTDVMDMLQSLSDLMDQHERGELSRAQRCDEESESREGPPPRDHPGEPHHASETARRKPKLSSSSSFRVDTCGKSETPPAPVQSPEASRYDTPLQIVVEQLYARCQLLERERTQMMETTLDLLTSARKANEAELDAALSTARRRAAEEVMRVRQETHREKERLYHKVCGACAKGLLITSSGHKVTADCPAAVSSTMGGPGIGMQ